jgi:hypothetical protein
MVLERKPKQNLLLREQKKKGVMLKLLAFRNMKRFMERRLEII